MIFLIEPNIDEFVCGPICGAEKQCDNEYWKWCDCYGGVTH